MNRLTVRQWMTTNANRYRNMITLLEATTREFEIDTDESPELWDDCQEVFDYEKNRRQINHYS